MKDDTISRAAALDALGEEPPVWYDGEDEIAERDQWRRDVAAIKALPSATDTNVGGNLSVDELITFLNPESNYVFYDDSHGFCINTQDVLDHLCAMPSAQLAQDLPKGCTDMISRADAIKAICEDGTRLERQGKYSITMAERKQRDADILEALPSATDTNVATTDTISRQAAIETVRKAKDKSEAHRMLIQLPPTQPDIETLLKLAVAMTKPIEYLNLSVRSYNALKRRGVDSVAKVYELKQKENLKKIRNIGAKSADEIEDCLNAYLAQWEEGQDDGSN